MSTDHLPKCFILSLLLLFSNTLYGVCEELELNVLSRIYLKHQYSSIMEAHNQYDALMKELGPHRGDLKEIEAILSQTCPPGPWWLRLIKSAITSEAGNVKKLKNLVSKLQNVDVRDIVKKKRSELTPAEREVHDLIHNKAIYWRSVWRFLAYHRELPSRLSDWLNVLKTPEKKIVAEFFREHSPHVMQVGGYALNMRTLEALDKSLDVIYMDLKKLYDASKPFSFKRISLGARLKKISAMRKLLKIDANEAPEWNDIFTNRLISLLNSAREPRPQWLEYSYSVIKQVVVVGMIYLFAVGVDVAFIEKGFDKNDGTDAGVKIVGEPNKHSLPPEVGIADDEFQFFDDLNSIQ
jgi:hypothetical protein